MRVCKSLLFVLLMGLLGHCAGQLRVSIGVLPTFNAGGDNFGPVFSQHLTLKLSQQLQSEGAHAVLLNPGGFYNPTDDDFLLEYGRNSGVDFLLITTLLKMQVPEKGNCTIAVQTEVLDLKSGTRSGPWTSAVEISKRDATPDYRTIRMNLAGDFYIGPSRLFEKQPLGKAVAAIAEQVKAQVLQAVRRDTVAVSARQTADTGSCDVLLKVLYTSRHAASKNYTMFVNGKDESMGVNDGALLLHNQSGSMLLQWSLNDAPYKLPKQELYQAASEVDCSKPARQLNIKIGAAGEALLDWQ